MSIVSRIITGTILIIFGAILTFVSFRESFWILIYGIPLILIGFFILFNKKEDEIEQIKRRKKK